MPDYDAFMLVSFGGPESPDEVMPFLENVTRGRRIPPGRLAAVAEHYYASGGVSPINQQCRDLLAAIGKDFASGGRDAPRIDKIRHYFNHPGFIEPVADATREAISRLPPDVRDGVPLVFTAHSIP